VRSSVSTHPSVYALVAPNNLPNGGYHFSEDEVKFYVSGGGGFMHALCFGPKAAATPPMGVSSSK
jgi:hypothetical protein